MKKNINKKLVGQRIKNIRQEKGMTLEEFGKIFGASKSNVRSWEIGTNLPNPERLKTIAKIADISVEELLHGDILRHFFNQYWDFFVKEEDTTKKYFNLDQKTFEYVQSAKQTVFHYFYDNALKYGYNDINQDVFFIFSSAVNRLLGEYYEIQLHICDSRLVLLQTVSKSIEQIVLKTKAFEEKTSDAKDKVFCYQLLEITEEFTKKFDLISDKYEKNT